MAQNATALKSSRGLPVTILGLDSALTGGSVAVMRGDAVLAHETFAGPRGQAERLMPMVQEAMATAGIGFSELDLIAATVGPGSFTGLRIGLAAARGLALAASVPVAGVGTLEALAAGVAPDARAGRTLVAAIDARRDEIYFQAFAAPLRPLAPPRLMSLADIATMVPSGPLAIVGSAGPLVAAALPDRDLLLDAGPPTPDAVVVARLALSRGLPEAGGPPPAPLYLRAPDARLPAGA